MSLTHTDPRVDVAEQIRADLVADVEAGFETLVRAHSSHVYSMHLRLCGSPADASDLGQETFVRALTALRRFPPERLADLQPRAWLATIGMNVWRNHLRDSSRRPSAGFVAADDAPEQADPEPGPEQAAVAADGWNGLEQTLGQLPESQRAAVVLRHVVGLSYAEIGEAVRCPEGTAKARVSRGMAALRTMIANEKVPV